MLLYHVKNPFRDLDGKFIIFILKDPNKDWEPKAKKKENDKNKNIQQNDIEQINTNFGFRTPQNAPQPKELICFEIVLTI